MKECSKCKIEKALVEFHVKSANSDGRASICKCCKSNVDKEYRIQNKIYLKEKSKQYRESNIELYNEKRRTAYNNATDEQKLKRAEKKALYNKNVADEVKQRKKDYDKKYFSSEKGKIVTLKSVHKRRAQKLSSEDGSITTKSLEQLKITQEFKCVYCNTHLDFSKAKSVHLDHVIPLSKGGTHSLVNVVWSCSSCNLKKSNKS